MALFGSALAENLGRTGYTVRGYHIVPDRMCSGGTAGSWISRALLGQLSRRASSPHVRILLEAPERARAAPGQGLRAAQEVAASYGEVLSRATRARAGSPNLTSLPPSGRIGAVT